MGHLATSMPVLFTAAKRSVSPPTRPKNMRSIRITCENVLRFGVSPSERPTVPMAEAVSKMQVSMGTLSKILIMKAPKRVRFTYIIIRVAALLTVESSIRLSKS